MRFVLYAIQLGALSLALQFVVSPVQAVTCDEVRGLSATELADWAKRLKVKRADLAALLELSFCEMSSDRARTIVSDRKGKAPGRTPSSL